MAGLRRCCFGGRQETDLGPGLGKIVENPIPVKPALKKAELQGTFLIVRAPIKQGWLKGPGEGDPRELSCTRM